MTVCVAAIATDNKGEQYIVTASDRMLSTQELSADAVALKAHFIAQDWGMMWSAEDTSHITPIWEMARAMLLPKHKHVHCDEVANVVANAYQRQLREEATARYLSRYGLSMPEFLREGSKLFPAAQYEEMHREIRSLRLGCDFLVYGFDDEAHIFRVSEPGKITFENEVGFAAIGSGWYSAISTLFFHSVSRLDSMWEVFYHVLEAKFMAETAPGVGGETHCEILSSFGKSIHVFDGAIDEVRRLWGRSGMPRVPRNAESEVTDIIHNCTVASARVDKQINVELEKLRKRHRARAQELGISPHKGKKDEPTSPKPGAKSGE
jgi:hypothetical protein